MGDHVSVLTGESAQPEPAFDPGEVAGMRSAGVILLLGAAVTILAWASRPVGVPVSILIDVFLGVQLLRLKHSWRAWAMLRAALGGLLAIVGVGGLILGAAPASAVLAGTGSIAYCAAILLLLVGAPTSVRVRVGQAVFALAVVLMVGAILLIAAGSPVA